MASSRKSSSVSPSRKRRKLSTDYDDTDGKMLDLSIDSNENSNNGTTNEKNDSINIGKYKYTKLDKLTSLGRHVSKSGVDLIAIREKVHALVSNPARCTRIIDRINMDSKRRAQGADICYKVTVNKNGKTIKKKLPLIMNIQWATKVPSKGGAGSGVTDVEYTALIPIAFNFVNICWNCLCLYHDNT